jgi:Domain of unknown function (DUF6265)
MRHATLALAAVVLFARGASAVDASVNDVGWLAGCWQTASERRMIEEIWMAPSGGTMINVGRTVAGGQTVDHEFVIVRVDNGTLVYEAHPAGQAPTVFRATEVSATRVVFENRAHDYPQQVGYEKTSANALTAWIDGTQNGQPRRVAFPYQRAACPGPR